MAKRAAIVPVQVLDCASVGSAAGVLAGIQWATRHAHSHNLSAVMVLSLGGDGTGTAYDGAIAAARAGNMLAVVAAGNDARDACDSSPASSAEAVTVSATEMGDHLATFSNHGPCVDVLAPGAFITAAWPTSRTATRTLSGTSMAAPSVAGALALIRSMRPHWTASRAVEALRCAATRGAVHPRAASHAAAANTTCALLYAGAGLFSRATPEACELIEPRLLNEETLVRPPPPQLAAPAAGRRKGVKGMSMLYARDPHVQRTGASAAAAAADDAVHQASAAALVAALHSAAPGRKDVAAERVAGDWV